MHDLTAYLLTHTPLHHQTSEREMARKELAANDHSQLGDASEDVIYKIDIPANRYDMLCLEGIARALNIFKGRTPPPHYRLADMRGGGGAGRGGRVCVCLGGQVAREGDGEPP